MGLRAKGVVVCTPIGGSARFFRPKSWAPICAELVIIFRNIFVT